MGQPNLETLLGWKGDAEHLAHLAKEWCALLGIEPRAELSVRLVRDYAQRGILGRPRRDGKVAIYDWEHLVCLLAARRLVRDGWPLQKISEEFTVRSIEEIRSLLPHSLLTEKKWRIEENQGKKEDPALEALREIKSRKPQPSYHNRAPSYSGSASTNTPFITPSSLLHGDLATSRRVLGEKDDQVCSSNFVRIEIARGIELHIESERLRSLGLAEAQAIAKAILSILLTPKHRK